MFSSLIRSQDSLTRTILIFSLGTLSLGGPAFAEDADQGVKKYGVVFDIASDRRVEKAGGIYQPEGLDKYIKRLTDDLAARITALEESNKRNGEKLDAALALLKDQKIKEVPPQKEEAKPPVRNIFR